MGDRGEAGATVVLAIVTLGVLSLLAAAILSLAEVGFAASDASRDFTGDVYAADNLAEALLASVASSEDGCPSVGLTTNGVTVAAVDCEILGPLALPPDTAPELTPDEDLALVTARDVRFAVQVTARDGEPLTTPVRILDVRALIDEASPPTIVIETWVYAR